MKASERKYPMEILAPAGGKEQLVAAVRSGADAVYFGVENFNARRNAENFVSDELSDIVGYLKARNVKSYITLNTLVKDDEISEVLKTVEKIARSGADGVIVQDMGIAALIKKCVPSLSLHASTQMSIHNIAGVKILEDMQFSQVVLARELSIQEIKKISASSDIKLETFVHGALCMSISGMCYLSSMIGARSGNRGQCAQPCRLNFSSADKEYALSLKDMTYIKHLSKLYEAGVTTLKIEGRMKRAEYVACAVSALNAALSGEDFDFDLLRKVFSREGFTDGYLTKRMTRDMFGCRTKQDVENMQSVLKSLHSLYRNERKSVNVAMDFKLHCGKNAVLSISDGSDTVTVTGDVAQTALKKPVSEEIISKYLNKTGATPFKTSKITCDIQSGLMTSAACVNEMRRKACDELLRIRSIPSGYEFNDTIVDVKDVIDNTCESHLRFRYEDINQFSDNFAQKAQMLIFPIEQILKNPGKLERYFEKVAFELPYTVFPEQEEKVSEMIERILDTGIKNVYVNNLGALKMCRGKNIKIHGGFGLNIMNSQALNAAAELGLEDAVLSFELEYNKIKSIKKQIPSGIIGYGYLPLMRTRICPVSVFRGCNSSRQCFIKDRYGIEFKVICSSKKDIAILNSVPLFIGDKCIMNINFEMLYFTVENAAQTDDVINQYINKEKPNFKLTRGLYFRGVK